MKSGQKNGAEFVSIIVNIPKVNDYICQEIIPALKSQSFKNFELLIVHDGKKRGCKLADFVKEIPAWPETGPAQKKDIGVKKAKGKIEEIQ